jgi:ribosome maturation protein SDO1
MGGGSGRKSGDTWIELDAVVIGIKKGHLRFELFVDPDLAFKYRRGEDIPLEDILKSYTVYEDARRGEHAAESLVKDAFGSSEIFDIAPSIIKQGEFKLTHEQRVQLVHEKTESIIDNIAKRAMNQIDAFISVDEQIPSVVKALRVIIPISFESVKLQITIPATYSGKGYNMVSNAGVIKSESWNLDGSWTGLVELPAQKRQELYDELNRLTKGQIRIEVVR